MNLVFASRKGKKMPTIERHGKRKRLAASIMRFGPMEDFQISPETRGVRFPSISKIVDFAGSLKKEGLKYDIELSCLERLLKKISSEEKNMPKLNLLGDIIGNRNFRPDMISPLYLISRQKKDSLLSFRIFNHSLLNKVFHQRIFSLCLKVSLDENLLNREKAAEALQCISNSESFDDGMISFLERIFEKSSPEDIYWNLYALQKVMNSRNFSRDVSTMLSMMPDDSFSSLHWCLELVDGFLCNGNFSKFWVSSGSFSDIYTMSSAISRGTSRENSMEAFLSLKRFLSASKDADGKIGTIRAEIEAIDSEPKLIGFIKSLK
ncbi:MAG: hypothetical protein NTY68_02355 [Candidatus Micrarchaeota archaeon]|nr:hypothetical protein [Candidatus Micrarchaeota archaeon]